MAEQKTRTFSIVPGTAKTKDGRTFRTYKAVTRNGTFMDAKFRKEIPQDTLPSDVFDVVVDDRDWNVDRNRMYPVLWIKAAVEIIPRVREFGQHTAEDEELF